MTHLTILALTTLALTLPAFANPVPAELPDPDPADAGAPNKPVKVYILAGQSNMVGMGNLGGAKNMYSGVYFTTDPAVPAGPLNIYKVGNYKINPLTVCLPDGSATDKPVADGSFEVPQQGTYQFHCGFGDSSYNSMLVDGREVYRRDLGGDPVLQDVTLAAGKRHSFKISGFRGDPPRFWAEKTDLVGHGDLESVAKRDGKFPWLVDEKGEWTVRNDVYFQEARVAKDGKGSPLSPISNNGKSIGPELGFGHVLGTFHDEQVLLIKTAMGNRALGFDFRPPSSGRTDPDNEWESKEYQLMLEGVHKTLDNIDKVIPGYQGQGYEIAGFAWFQGHKDSFSEELIAEYEKNLVNLINDVRKEFEVPKMPAVIASNGFGGYNMQEKFLRIHAAQMAVGDPQKHPEFAGTVASVDIRDFWREVDESPKGEDYHYNRNAETYMLIGDALGRAMVGLLGGKAEPLPLKPRPKQADNTETAEPTEEEKAAMQLALRPIVMDGIAADYIANPRYNKQLVQEATGARPDRPNQFLRGAMYGLLNCYRAAGITDYDWKLFGKDLRDVEWDYFSFDPPETMDQAKSNRYRKVTYPAGMENWFAPDFDPAKAGWKKGLPPFGQAAGELKPLRECTRDGHCGCGEVPKTLWEKEVLMLRGTFEVPPLKDGHRYRIVVGGSNHVNTGEGYAVYLDGIPLAESKTGVPNRQGGQPRGAPVFADARQAFKDGKVTIAVTGFLRTNKPNQPVPQGHLTVWLEEQKTPTIEEAAAAGK